MPRHRTCLSCAGACVTPVRVCAECQRATIRELSRVLHSLERWSILVEGLLSPPAASGALRVGASLAPPLLQSTALRSVAKAQLYGRRA